MKFTFGIITAGTSDESLNLVIDSIERQNIPEYQILVVGNSQVSRKNTFIIPFDESIRPGWITRKKNIVTINSRYENVVYTHDYVLFEDDWYEGFLKFGDDFKICINKFVNPDYSRFRDWVIWPHNDNFMDSIVLPNRECLIPYDMTHLSRYQYISGTYWVAKRYVMEDHPLDDNLLHCQGEDVEWSKRVRQKYDFSMNPYSTVKSLKFKDPAFNVAGEETIQKLRMVQ
jgi:hypothetical protein